MLLITCRLYYSNWLQPELSTVFSRIDQRNTTSTRKYPLRRNQFDRMAKWLQWSQLQSSLTSCITVTTTHKSKRAFIKLYHGTHWIYNGLQLTWTFNALIIHHERILWASIFQCLDILQQLFWWKQYKSRVVSNILLFTDSIMTNKLPCIIVTE